MTPWLTIPPSGPYVLHNAFVPDVCVDDGGAAPTPGSPPRSALRRTMSTSPDVDSLLHVDISVNADGVVTAIEPARPRGGARGAPPGVALVDARCGIVLPAFCDLHTHIDKSHTCERSRNAYGSLSGADRSTARDAALWSRDDVARRMEFSVATAYAHGTAALRTHLINMAPRQVELTWPAFAAVRARWAGRVELQGVSLVVLSFFRDAAAAAALADTVAAHGGVLGAAVCCAENGGDPDDEWTTCPGDRDELLDRIFALASARSLDLDFHVDENGNRAATGLRDVARAALRCAFKGKVVCGHCCSLAALPPDELAATADLVRRAGITVVSLPLVNEWTQDRDPAGRRTPRWRGVPPLLELAAAGVAVAVASDNVRDQFYPYGDYDMLHVLARATAAAHLDTPYGAWPAAATRAPADAMRLPTLGRIAVGAPANVVAFRARAYSELFARPHADRAVVRGGRAAVDAVVPDYDDLYSAAASVAPPRGFGGPGYDGRLSPAPSASLDGGGSGVPPVANGEAAKAGPPCTNGGPGPAPPSPGLRTAAPPPRGLEGGVVTDARTLHGGRAARPGARSLTPVPEAGAALRDDGVKLAAAASMGAAVGAAAAWAWLRKGKW